VQFFQREIAPKSGDIGTLNNSVVVSFKPSIPDEYRTLSIEKYLKTFSPNLSKEEIEQVALSSPHYHSLYSRLLLMFNSRHFDRGAP
jgi:hypothetical protein